MENNILPPRLKKGKLIGVIAPADPVFGACPEEIINQGCKYLEEKGFSVILGDSTKAFSKKHIVTPNSLVINDINNFIKNDNVGCVMAFWGGFNTNRILKNIDYSLIKKNPKIFIGYSDITALTTAITVKTGLITFSGPGVISFAKPEPFDYTWEYFEKICINPRKQTAISSSLHYADDLYFLREDSNHRIIKNNEGIKIFNKGRAHGEVVAGNLQTLLALNGTDFFPDLKNKILFIEEDETSTPAHVERFICQCEQLGWFDKISGLVIGRFTEYSGFSESNPLEDILKTYFLNASFPVMYNADFGHSDPLITIPNGGVAIIDTEKKEIVFNQAVL